MVRVGTPLKNSLRFRLSLWLSTLVLVVAGVATILSVSVSYDEVHELQDDLLLQMGALLQRTGVTLEAATHLRYQFSEEAMELSLEPLPDWLARQPSAGVAAAMLSPASADGLYDWQEASEDYRLALVTIGAGQRIVIMQNMAFRDQVARAVIWITLLPFVMLVLVLLGLITLLVNRMLKPLADAARDIEARSEHDLQPVESLPLPEEIRPFVASINRLLGRVAESQRLQQRFLADAAHELRSPLTALSLQVERLAGSDLSVSARSRVETLQRGIERSRGLVEQLLALAKVRSLPPANAQVVLADVFRRVLEDVLPLAESRHIEMSLSGAEGVRLTANETDLIVLIKNLLDNAIRYTPPGGAVTMAVVAGETKVTLVVEDNGPGIPLAERERVFDPFYRIVGTEQTGSGLGLAIARAVVDRLGGQIGVADAQGSPQGLRVEIVLPMA